MSDQIKKITEDVLESIEKDRKSAQDLVDDLGKYIGQSAERYSTVGMTMAKYLEALQRSNEQRIKLISIMAKKGDDDFGEVSEQEAAGIYEDFEKEDAEDGA